MSRAWVAGLEQLADEGFEELGGRRYRRDDLDLDARGDWWTFRCPAPSPAPNREDWLARPGLWKIGDRGGAVQACDLPARALGLDSAIDLAPLLTWVEATRGPTIEGDPEPQEHPPAVDPVELTARVGPFTCQGKVEAEGSRLWVDYPLATLPDDLSATRQRWMQAMLIAARQLRMVRVERTSGWIHARVDLTGVPPLWREPLLTQGLASLRSVVEGLLPSITVLTTASVTCRALELGSLAPTTKEPTNE